MDKKWILIMSFVIIMVALGFYFYGKENEKPIIVDNGGASAGGNLPLGKCYQRTDEAPFNKETIPWGYGISFSKATTGTFDEDTDNLYKVAVMSFLKGIDVQPSWRTIALFADDIRNYRTSKIGNIREWDIKVGEFLCN